MSSKQGNNRSNIRKTFFPIIKKFLYSDREISPS